MLPTLNSTSMMKLLEVRGRRLQSHPCKNAARNQQMPRKGKDMYHLRLDVTRQPNVFVGVLSETGESQSWSERKPGQRRTTYVSAPKSYHLRANGQVTLTAARYLKRTDFEGLGQCTVQIGNVFAVEPSERWEMHVQYSTLRHVSLRTRSMVRFAIRVPS